VLRKPSAALACVATALAALLASAAPASAEVAGCDQVASPGNDAVEHLLDSLRPGQTGCLHGGLYDENVKVTTPGVTLTRYGDEHAIVKGRFWIARGANGVTVEDLYIDGTNRTNLPSPTINASDATFRRNDVTNYHHSICFNLGHPDWGAADGAVLEDNRVHDCGRLPATNHDHGIYVAEARGVLIRGNWIYDNADYGVHLYPDAQNTKVIGNVIDGNGEGLTFSGDYGLASNGNLVEGNVIANSKVRYNIESWFPPGNPISHGNVARGNCVKGGVRDDGNGGIAQQWGFRVVDNTRVRPAYADRAARDFRLVGGSVCGRLLGAALRSDVPGPDGLRGSRAARVRHRSHGVILGAVRTNVRRGQRLKLLGQVSAAHLRPGLRVSVFARAHGHRRLLARAAVRRNGIFVVHPHVRAPRKARFVRITAVVRGIGHSRSIRLRIRHR
jgi:parallel beta-helix repeat protein